VRNCLYCGKVNPRPKYCSKECTKSYYKEVLYVSVRGPGWGDKSREDKRLKEERNKEYEEAIKGGWVSVVSIAEEVGLTSGAMNTRVRKHLQEDIDTKMLHLPKGRMGRYVHPDAIEKIKDPYAIPEGYLAPSQAAEYMGWTYNIFHYMSKEYDLVASAKAVLRSSRGKLVGIYTIDDLEQFKKNISDLRQKREEERREQRRAKGLKSKEEEEAGLRRRREEYEELTKGLIRLDDCLPYFGTKSTGPILKLLHEGKLSAQKIRNRWWFKPEDVEAAAESYKENKRTKIKKRKSTNLWKRSGHKYKNANQRYEAKQQRKFRKDTSRVALVNKKYWEDEEKGIIHFFHCKACDIGQPYCEFHVDDTYPKEGRRVARCKTCLAKQNKEKPKKPMPLKRKIRHIFGIAIKQHMSKMRNEYLEDLSLKVMWRKLEEHCGYDEEKLIKHIESQFVGEMSWDNHGQLGTTIERGNFCWAIDHIKSKNSFHYTSLNDKAFVECWSLDNLRPLETRINMIKSDKKLRSGMNSSFTAGLKRKEFRGIWKALSYTPEQARKHMEKQFDKNMNWDNYGTYWHIDHIRPQASLPYKTTACENFKKCWSLRNLRPLSAQENLGKNSVWNEARWIYNDIDE
tara:strand:- start:348 stop:2225 length:1878 start_codon:yes stop_codon:yes gene_type:complete